MTIWRMCITCCIPKATNTDLQYVIIIALPPQQWLQERASKLRYMYIARLVKPYGKWRLYTVYKDPVRTAQ